MVGAAQCGRPILNFVIYLGGHIGPPLPKPALLKQPLTHTLQTTGMDHQYLITVLYSSLLHRIFNCK